MNGSMDINCDLGEGLEHDAALMPLITSANIACGGHAGNFDTMRRAVALAQQHGVSIGAHPGFADREHFGRREISLPPAEVQQLVQEQMERLISISPIKHVKAHGALYNMASRDSQIAGAITRAIHSVDPNLICFAPPKSELSKSAESLGLRVAHEIFADRSYQTDGSLTPRTEPGALIHSAEVAVAKVLRRIHNGTAPDTICIHSDGSDPVGFALRLRAALSEAQFALRSVG